MSHQVFISFSSKDIKLAEKIYDRLWKNGITCWISSKNIPAGADYQACIVDAINQATIVVLIFSTHANSSNEIAKELSLASKKILIPTRIEDVLPQGAFQYQLSNRQFIDLFDDFDNRLNELSDRIKIALDPSEASQIKPRKKSVNWRKMRLKLAAIAGSAVLLIGGFFISRGYMNASNVAAVDGLSTSIKSAAVAIPPTRLSGNAAAIATPNSSLNGTLPTSTALADTAATQNSTTANSKAIAAIKSPEIQPPVMDTNTSRLALNVSDQVSGLANMLNDLRQQARAVALKDMLSSLPKKLNAKEADVLLNNTYQYRTAAITTIAGNLANDLDGEEVATVLGDTTQQGRLQALQTISKAEKIKKNLTADEAGKVLANTFQYRTDSIAVLAPNLAGNLGGTEVATVLGDITQQARLQALQTISKAEKIKKNLTADESNKVLSNTFQYRAESIAVLAPYLTGNLGGTEVATVLGDISQQSRLQALQTISKAEKIKKDLTTDEANKVLSNTHQYRTESIAVLAPYLVGNLGGTEVATILGDLTQQARLVALISMMKLGKVRRGLKPEEIQPILNGMHQYASNAIAELASYIAK